MQSKSSECPTCPQCGVKDKVVPILYGRPTPPMMQEYNQGKAYLGGCICGDETHYCNKCELRFIGTQESSAK